MQFKVERVSDDRLERMLDGICVPNLGALVLTDQQDISDIRSVLHELLEVRRTAPPPQPPEH